MENKPRRSLSNLYLSDMFFGLSYLPALNLLPTRPYFKKDRKKMNFLDMQQVNHSLNEKLNNKFSHVSNILPKTWMDSAYETKVNLGHYSRSLTKDLEKAIEMSMKQLSCLKYSNKIIDMFNSETITRNNNTDTLIYSKANKDFDTTDHSNKELQRETEEIMTQINQYSLNIINATKNCDEFSNVGKTITEKPLVLKTWRKCNIIERNSGRARNKVQLKNSETTKWKYIKEKSNENLRFNIKEDMDTWMEGHQDSFDLCSDDCDTLTNSGDSSLFYQHDDIIPKNQIADSNHSTFSPTISVHLQKSIRRPKKNFDSPIQSPKDYLAMTCNFRSRLPSESSIDSEGSCCYIFQDESECESTDSDSPTLSPSVSVHLQTFIHRDTKNKFDSPVQSPKDYLSMTCNFRSRFPSESSIESAESCCIIFQDDSELNSADSDDESPDSDEDNDESNYKVRFSLKPEVHMMFKWAYAYRAARKGPWEEIARDRERFRSRINCVSQVINPILSSQHREKIYQNRFTIQN